MTKEMIQIQNSLEEFRADQLGAMLTTCRRIIQTDKDECAIKVAEILRVQVLFELARRTHLENGAEATEPTPEKKYAMLIASSPVLQYVIKEMPANVAAAAILQTAKEQDDIEWARWEAKNI